MLVIELRQEINAPLEHIWALVSDPRRQPEFVGYQVSQVEASNACEIGPDFAWDETGVLLGKRYACPCRVLGWEPPQWYCFGTPNLFHISFELEPAPGGTRLLYRVELPQTPETRHEPIADVCRETVENLKRLLEVRPGGGSG